MTLVIDLGTILWWVLALAGAYAGLVLACHVIGWAFQRLRRHPLFALALGFALVYIPWKIFA